MSSKDERQTKTQRQLTPTHILERAIDQLPPDERGRAREALEELEGRIDEVERLREGKKRLADAIEHAANALDRWDQAASVEAFLRDVLEGSNHEDK